MEQSKVRWRKVGGGSLRLRGRIIKPNEVFSAAPDEIPKLFMQFVVQLDKTPEPAEPVIVRTRKKFEVKQVEEEPVETLAPEHAMLVVGGGWYDIVNIATGKVLNEKHLRKDAADRLLAELNG